MIYKFPQFPHLGNISPEFYLNTVRDDVRNKIATIELSFDINDETCSIDIEYNYETTWEDNDALIYAMNWIEKYKIS